MLREKVESKIGQVSESEFNYAMEQLTMVVMASDYNYRNDDFILTDFFINTILEKRHEGVQNV